MRYSKYRFLFSYLTVPIIVLLTIQASVVKGQTRTRKSRARVATKKARAKQTQSPLSRVENEQELALRRLFNAANGLELSWRNRFYGGNCCHTEELTTAEQKAIVVMKNETLRNAISRMTKAYLDAVSLYELAEDRASNPLAGSYTAPNREKLVKELRRLKDQLHKQYDDPIARDQLRGEINLLEALLRNEAARGTEIPQEDPFAKNLRQQKIDARAKLLLEPYGLQDAWPEKRWDLTEELFNVGKTILASISECLEQPASCSALHSAIQSAPSVLISP